LFKILENVNKMPKIKTTETYFREIRGESVRVLEQEHSDYPMKRTVLVGKGWVEAPSFQEVRARWMKRYV
jgi:hypothetical protein